MRKVESKTVMPGKDFLQRRHTSLKRSLATQREYSANSINNAHASAHPAKVHDPAATASLPQKSGNAVQLTG